MDIILSQSGLPGINEKYIKLISKSFYYKMFIKVLKYNNIFLRNVMIIDDFIRGFYFSSPVYAISNMNIDNKIKQQYWNLIADKFIRDLIKIIFAFYKANINESYKYHFSSQQYWEKYLKGDEKVKKELHDISFPNNYLLFLQEKLNEPLYRVIQIVCFDGDKWYE